MAVKGVNFVFLLKVTPQWNTQNFQTFIEYAKKAGLDIQPIK